MTTIAYRDGVLAADTQINSGNGNRAGSIEKIGVTADGHWWAFSGATQLQAACAAWAETRQGDPPDIDGLAVLIIIAPNGSHREWWGKGWLEVADPQAAWGSGERIARGAMFAGADAVQAVQAAIALDPESGGTISVLRRESVQHCPCQIESQERQAVAGLHIPNRLHSGQEGLVRASKADARPPAAA